MTMDARPDIERRHEDVYGDRSERYCSAIMALLEDGAFCGEDAAVLEGFRAYLGLDPSEAEALFQEEARAYIRRRMLRFLADGKLTPAADHRLSDLVQAVGLSPPWDDQTALILEHARQTWRLAHGPLPVVQTPLGLVRRERAHVWARCSAYEDRDRTVSAGYAGLTFSLPIAKGLRFRVGQFAVNRQTLRYSHRLGSGDLCVTNERLIFRSSERAITARLTSIIDVTAYHDGVTVLRTQGKPITFVLAEPDADFALVLWRAWQEARGYDTSSVS